MQRIGNRQSLFRPVTKSYTLKQAYKEALDSGGETVTSRDRSDWAKDRSG